MTGAEYLDKIRDMVLTGDPSDATVNELMLALEAGFYDVDWTATLSGDRARVIAAIERQFRKYGKEVPTKLKEQFTNLDIDGTDATDAENRQSALDGELGGGTVFPQWMMDRFFNGNDGQVADADELLEAINAARLENGDEPFLDLLDVPDTGLNSYIMDTIVESMYPAEEAKFEPYITLKLKFGNDFTIKTDDLSSILQKTGFDEAQFSRLLELADAYNMRREGPGEEINWQVPLMLMNMTGHVAAGETYKGTPVYSRRLRELAGKIKSLKDDIGPTTASGSRAHTLEALEREYEKEKATAKLSQVGQTTRMADRDPDVNGDLGQLFTAFGEGVELYGSIESLALLHAVDPALAARLWAANGDVRKVSAEDKNLAGMWVSRALPGAGNGNDLLSQALVEFGFGEAGGDRLVVDIVSQIDAVRNPDRVGRDGTSTGAKMLPDRVGVEDRVKVLMETMYPQAVSDEQVAEITDRVISEYTGAPEDQLYDLDAQVRRAVESLPQYGEFYGNKPGGVSNSSYATTMALGAQSMLGAEAGLTGAAGLGMRSGKYQTAVGAAAGTSAAWDNSTFMGRLAEAARVVSANT